MTEEKKFENFEDPLFKEVDLHEDWTFWEQWRSTEKSQGFQDSMQKIGAFNDLLTFCKIWKGLPHSDLSNVFYDQEKDIINHYVIREGA